MASPAGNGTSSSSRSSSSLRRLLVGEMLPIPRGASQPEPPAQVQHQHQQQQHHHHQSLTPTTTPTSTPAPHFASPSPTNDRPRVRAGLVKIACEACRRRKAKCTGDRPSCKRCLERNLDCVYESENPHETTGQLLKRKYSQLTARTDTFEELFRHIKELGPEQSQQVLKKIRTGEDAAKIVRQLEAGSLLQQMAVAPDIRIRYDFPYVAAMPQILLSPENPYASSVLYRATWDNDDSSTSAQSLLTPGGEQGRDTPAESRQSASYLLPYFAAELAEPHLSSVFISDFTLVCRDESLLKKLLKSYFLHDYETFGVFHKDIFLAAMKTGDQRFCTPMLVNAILAKATHSYEGIADRPAYWRPGSLGYLFLAEAKRLWELEQHKEDLTIIHTSMALHTVYTVNGMDQIGLAYLMHAVSLAKKLGILNPSEREEGRYQLASDFTAWALFRAQALYGIYYFRASLIRDPPLVLLPDVDSDPSWYPEVMLVYPTNEVVPTHGGLVFKASCDLRIIMNRISFSIFGQKRGVDGRMIGRTLSAAEIQAFRSQLQRWYDNLPEPLTAEKAVLPAQMRLHMEYWALQFKLLQMVPHAEPLRSPGPLGVNENRIVPGTAAEAVANLETVIRMYYRRHSFQACDTFMTNFVLMLATLMMEAIKQRTGVTSATHLEHLRSTVLLCVKCLYDQGKSVHCSNVIYRLLRDGLEPNEMGILRGYIAPSEEAEKEPLDPQQARSNYPITVMRFDEDPEATLMENMVKQYNRMALGSPPAAGESPSQRDSGDG